MGARVPIRPRPGGSAHEYTPRLSGPRSAPDARDREVRKPLAGAASRCHAGPVVDFERCFRAVQSKDGRFDGQFFTAVTSTRIYCRPSCPALIPRRQNVRFYPTAAAAQSAGFRACKRCRPDATPGSPEWNLRADLVGRAMQLIADGAVDRDGVAGLARRLRYSERQLHRELVAEVGAGPLTLARTQRAHTARLLVETTDLPVTEVAFASGFSSLRQFNDTVREVFGATPTELRRNAKRGGITTPELLTLRLAYRAPFAGGELFRFLGERCLPGVEEYGDGVYRRSLSLHHGPAVVELSDAGGHVRCRLWLEDPRDLTSAVQRCRRLLDLDADPVAIEDSLAGDLLIAPLVRRSPGRRIPGHVDGPELALRAVLGQQVSVATARALASRLVTHHGRRLSAGSGSITHLFPEPGVLAEADPDQFPVSRARRRSLHALATALASGSITLEPWADRREAQEKLLELPGIGPWTASYVAMRALGDPDAFLETDLGVRRAVQRLAGTGDPRRVAALAERWRPWRSYATQHLWGLAGRSAAPAKKPGEPRTGERRQ